MGLIFNRKKSSSSDFTPDMLPQTKKEVFKDVFKLQFRTMMKIGLLVLIFTFPFHIINFISMGVKPTCETFEEIISFDISKSIWRFLAFMFFAVGFSGILRVIRRLAKLEHVDLMHDFVIGIKQNIGQTLVLAMLASIVIASIEISFDNLVFSEHNSLLYAIVLGISIFIIIPIMSYHSIYLGYYNNRFIQNVLLSLFSYTKHIFKTWLALICAASAFLLYLIPGSLVIIIIRLLMSFVVPFIILGFTLYVLNYVEKVINPTQEAMQKIQEEELENSTNNDVDDTQEELENSTNNDVDNIQEEEKIEENINNENSN